MPEKLGHLQRVELRDIWPNEATDFTPWLAEEANLALLAETLNMELEFESQERNVGDFRADILCRNTVDGSRVLIENQLEATDHSHLGQILTYASGLKAATIVWIAKEFREEHRAALDWQNEITEEGFQFFGVEIELWKVGDSLPAPKFNIVSKPNEWSRTVSQGAQRAASGELSETQLQQIKFWTGLRDYLIETDTPVQCSTPGPWGFLTSSLGRSGFIMEPWMSSQKKEIGIRLCTTGPNATAHFHLLKAQQEEIKSEFGESLEWEERSGQTRCRVSLRKSDTVPEDEADWPNQHKWLASKLEKFDKVFRQRIRALDATDWQPEDEDNVM